MGINPYCNKNVLRRPVRRFTPALMNQITPGQPQRPDEPAPDLADAVRRLKTASVLVVGDAMLDQTTFGEVHRVSVEAPVPILTIEREEARPGGAGNVVRNLTALGAATAFISVVGDDQAGSELTGLIDGVAKEGGDAFYVEVLAKHGHRKARPADAGDGSAEV